MRWIDEYDKEKYIEEKNEYIEAKGGDGTLIRAIHMHKDKKKPFFGVASGTVNFLMNPESHIRSLSKAIRFTLLKVEVTYDVTIPACNNFGKEETFETTETYEAFNDVVIGEFNGWINFDCRHEENIIGEFNGAGIIFSTAQGSTGINKNNNGTILALESKMLSVTGMQTDRRIDCTVNNDEITVYTKSRGNIKCAIDGTHKVINNVKRVKISKGSKVDVIFNSYEFFKSKRQSR